MSSAVEPGQGSSGTDAGQPVVLMAGLLALCVIMTLIWTIGFGSNDVTNRRPAAATTAAQQPAARYANELDAHPAFASGVPDDPHGAEVTGSSVGAADAADARPALGAVYDREVPAAALPLADPAQGVVTCSAASGCWQTAGFVRTVTLGTTCGERATWRQLDRSGEVVRMVCAQ
jgi:hypothetical protein